MDDVQFNPQEAKLFEILTGIKPPVAATALFYQAGTLASDTANRIDSELTPAVELVVGHVLTGMNSAVSPSFADHLAQYTTSPGYFPAMSAQLRQMADYSTSTAAQVEYLKIEAIATLSSLIASLVIEAVLSFFFPGLGLEMMAASCAVVRFLLSSLIGRILLKILSAALIGIGIQELLDAIAQGVLIGEGIQKDWNWKETGDMAAVGALGAAMGLVLHPLQEWATKKLASAIEDLISHEGDVISKDLAIDGAKDLGSALRDTPVLPEGKPGDGAGWAPTPPPVMSRPWLIEKAAEVPVAMVIGGVHNAGHETLYSWWTTGTPKWSWATFSGGAAQGLTRPVGVLIGSGGRFVFGLPVPAENLLAAALGPVTPAMLNDIANAPARLPGDGGPAGSGKAGQAGPGAGGPQAAAGPPAVALLRAVNVQPGPDTAYAIAVRTGFVPTIGPAEFHADYSRPVLVTLPPMTTTTAMAAALGPAGVPALPAASREGPLPPSSLVDTPAPSATSQVPALAGDVPGQGSVRPGSLLDEPVPAEAANIPVLAPDVPATGMLATGQPQPVTGQPAQPGTVRADQQQVAQPGRGLSEGVSRGATDGQQLLSTPPGAGAGAGHVAPPAGITGITAHGDRPPQPGVASGGPDAVGQVSAPPSRAEAGTRWTRGADGLYVAAHDGSLYRGTGGGQVPAGSKGVFGGPGRLQHVVLPDGVSFERGLDGAWSGPRERPGEVIVVKTSGQVTMISADGTTATMLPPESEKVLDRGTPVAYRQVKATDGTRLARPRVFLPDGLDGWRQTSSPVETATYEAWLAGANQAHGAAQTLHDIAGRSSTAVPEAERLTSLDDAALKGLLGGSHQDAAAAIYEWVRRREGVSLRWTQVSASHALADGQIVNMAAGEGKSWLFLVDAARQAVRDDVGAVHVITTRGNLADREFERYHELLTPLGFDVHRMNSDNPPPIPVQGRPTIYIGTSQDVGFTFLKTGQIPGQDGTIRIDAGVDEIDEAFVYSNGQYILSEGVQREASPELIAQVRDARQLMQSLTPADFGRAEGQDGGPAALTAEGQAKAAELLGAPLSDELLLRLNMAATAHFEYVENIHYVVHDGKVFIIDQTTHDVLYNPQTATESRWNGGLAQAVEAKHDLTIRDDPGTSKSVTARELYARDVYGRVTGASGTALGKGDRFAAQGLSSQIADIPRYYSSRLGTGADHVSADLGAKLDAIAGDVAAMKAGSQNQPQLILAHRNDLVAELSAKLTGLGVEHTAIDAKWFLNQGINREEAFKNVIENAGKPGQVLVINMQGARGVDIPLSGEAKALGGLHVRVTARSGISEDIDIQAENRAARSGDPGAVSYYISPHDDAFALSHNPFVKLAIVQYTQARTAHAEAVEAGADTGTPQTREGLARAETRLRNLVRLAQAEGARRMGMYTPTHLPNAPPTAAAAPQAGASPPSPAQPPPQPPPVQASGSANGTVTGAPDTAEPAFAAPANPHLLRLQAERQELNSQLDADIVSPDVATSLRAQLSQVEAAIKQAEAQAATLTTPANGVTPGPVGQAGPSVVKAGAGLSFVTGTAPGRPIEQAAAAVPGAVSEQGGLWTTVAGHARPGFIEIHGAQVRADNALEIPGVREHLQTARCAVGGGELRRRWQASARGRPAGHRRG